MKVNESFRIFKKVNDFETGSLKPIRAYWKLVYTAALRMGIEVDTSKSELMIQADVEEFSEIIGHGGKEVRNGKLSSVTTSWLFSSLDRELKANITWLPFIPLVKILMLNIVIPGL